MRKHEVKIMQVEIYLGLFLDFTVPLYDLNPIIEGRFLNTPDTCKLNLKSINLITNRRFV